MSESLKLLNLELGFQSWAEAEGYDLEICPTSGLYVDPFTRGASRGYMAGQVDALPRQVGQQLYAEIKKSSKYANQAELCRTSAYGYPFKVHITHDHGGNYRVKGGVGGQYRLEDVNLYVIEDGNKIRIH